MNTNFDDLPLDDTRFDRLVDNELDEAERRELLAGLDDEPGGWRRCALAFLQSQCWQQTFAAMTRGGQPASAKSLRLSSSRRFNRLVLPLATAASFLLVFWLGAMLQQKPVGRPAAFPIAIEQIAASAPKQPAAGPWRMVTVSAPAGASVSLPAVERDGIDQKWLQDLPPAVPDEVVQAFNRTGHQVEQHRELVPVPLQDGRRLVVPVDRVDVHYVGNETY